MDTSYSWWCPKMLVLNFLVVMFSLSEEGDLPEEAND